MIVVKKKISGLKKKDVKGWNQTGVYVGDNYFWFHRSVSCFALCLVYIYFIEKNTNRCLPLKPCICYCMWVICQCMPMGKHFRIIIVRNMLEIRWVWSTSDVNCKPITLYSCSHITTMYSKNIVFALIKEINCSL